MSHPPKRTKENLFWDVTSESCISDVGDQTIHRHVMSSDVCKILF